MKPGEILKWLAEPGDFEVLCKGRDDGAVDFWIMDIRGQPFTRRTGTTTATDLQDHLGKIVEEIRNETRGS